MLNISGGELWNHGIYLKVGHKELVKKYFIKMATTKLVDCVKN